MKHLYMLNLNNKSILLKILLRFLEQRLSMKPEIRYLFEINQLHLFLRICFLLYISYDFIDAIKKYEGKNKELLCFTRRFV